MKKIIVALLLAISLVFPTNSYAMTTAQEQARILELLTIIADLQARIAAILSGGGCLNLTTDLYPNSTDATTGGQVSRLQTFLVRQGLLVIPAGVSKGQYGIATQGAVQRFQAQYGIVYHGTPSTTGYGKVGPGTRAKLNSVSCATVTQTQPVTTTGGSAPVTAAPVSGGGGGSSASGGGSSGGGGGGGGGGAPSTLKQCNDHNDNDGDAVIDYPYEPGCTSVNDNSEGNDPLIIVQENISDEVWAINNSDDIGATKSYVFGADPEGDGTVSLSYMDNILDGTPSQGGLNIPNNFSGYLIIDLEDNYLDRLRLPTNHPLFIQAQNEMLRALRHGKERRPNAKWGFYSFPHIPYWLSNGTVGWDDATQAQKDAEIAIIGRPATLLSEVDVMTPSIYPPYPYAYHPQYVHENDIAFSKAAVDVSEIFASGRPVMPYISHRFFNGNTGPYTYLLVPWNEFQEKQIEAPLEAGADGVIWWGADRYYYWLATAPLSLFNSSCNNVQSCVQTYLQLQAILAPVFSAEIPAGMNSDDYFDELHEQYLRLIFEALGGDSYSPQPITAPSGPSQLKPGGTQTETPFHLKGALEQFFANLSQSLAATYQALINLFQGGN